MKITVDMPESELDEIAAYIAKRVAQQLLPEVLSAIRSGDEALRRERYLEEPKFLRIRDLVIRTGLSRSTIYKQVSEGKFPKPIKLGERCVAWRVEDIREWELGVDKA